MQATVNGKTQTNSIDGVATKPKKTPNRVMLYAPEKWGKTSFASRAIKPIFLCTEDGLNKLMEQGLAPDTAHFDPMPSTYTDVLVNIDQLIVKEHEYKTLIIDTLNGVEQLLHAQVTRKSFENDPVKFDAWNKGPGIAAKEWPEFTARIDRLRDKGMTTIMLCHSKIVTFANPAGDNYDRYQPELSKPTWAHFNKWLDMILFGSFETFITKNDKSAPKGKGKGGQQRMIYTERTAAFDAGNRHNLPQEIDAGSNPKEAWDNFVRAFKTTNT